MMPCSHLISEAFEFSGFCGALSERFGPHCRMFASTFQTVSCTSIVLLLQVPRNCCYNLCFIVPKMWPSGRALRVTLVRPKSKANERFSMLTKHHQPSLRFAGLNPGGQNPLNFAGSSGSRHVLPRALQRLSSLSGGVKLVAGIQAFVG